MSENIKMASVSFRPIDVLIDRARSLEIAGDEDSQKRVAETVAILRRSDELLEAQGNNLLQIIPILRNRDDLPGEPGLQFVKGILPAEDIANGRDAIMAFADEFERVRVAQGGETEPELDVGVLDLEDIDRVIAARDRLTDEYRLFISALSCKLIAQDEYTKRPESSNESILMDIVAREIAPGDANDLSKPTGATLPVDQPAAPEKDDFTPIAPPAPPSDDDLQPIVPPAPPEETVPEESGLSVDHGKMLSNERNQESSTAGPEAVGMGTAVNLATGHARDGKCADVVFVVDASGSMRECFDQLRTNIRKFVEPFREEGFESLRLGLLAYSANINRTTKKCIYRNIVIGGEGTSAMKELYGSATARDGLFFTRSKDGSVDTDSFMRRLDGVRCKGDEDTVFALDCAGDFPYGPLESTRRVMVLFTDEKIEDGVLKQESVGENFAQLEKVMKKIVDRHISLYVFAPASPATDMMSEFSRVFLTNVPEFRPEATDTWANIDFARVLEMMGKQVSSSLSGGNEQNFNRAVFGQDKWTDDRWS